jgi:hypothetical protein
MLALVIPIGAIILSSGMGEVSEFNQKVGVNGKQMIERVQEDVVFEHIHFVPSSKEVILSVRNTGVIETDINKITIVRMNTQDLIFSQDNLGDFLPLKDYADISIQGNLPGTDTWNDGDINGMYRDSDYKISIITTRGNFFDIIARPFNT